MAHLKPFLKMAFVTALAIVSAAKAADIQRQAEVARLGADVMPFTLEGTTHIFTKTNDGGIQRVIVKVPSDTEQVVLVREHLRAIQQQFSQGDFSGPTHIHGPAMASLSELKAAKPGQIKIEYKEVPSGAELIYRTEDTSLVSALHNWFDAQLSDHGTDAVAGDQQHHNHGALMKQ